jgi:two-component system response regulator FixJ
VTPLTVAPTYRPYFNRDRVVYILHQDVDQHEGISTAFVEQGFMVSATRTIEGLFRLAAIRRPDVVLLDLKALADNTDLMETLHSAAFGVRVFVIAEANAQTADIVRAVRSGALSVFTPPLQFTDMISTVVSELRTDLRDHAPGMKVQGKSALTPREIEIVQHVVGGETNKEIGIVLGISPRTVEVHRHAAMKKLGARNTAEMIRMILQA